MNQKDFQIIAYLRRNARMALTDMSRKTNIPVSTIFDRLKANEESFIVKHTCLLDFSKLGYMVRANISLKVERENRDALREFLMKSNCVNSLYKVSSSYDFLAECIFKQIKDLDSFIENVENRFKLQDKNTFFVIEDLKKEEFLSEPQLLDLY